MQRKMESDTLGCKSWELLREEGDEDFSIEKSVEQYRENCGKAVGYGQSAKFISNLLKKYKYNRVASLGIGKGVLEWHLKKNNPELYLIGTDYTESAIRSLQNVFTECDRLEVFDIKKDNFKKLNTDCVIMYRVSTEFDYKEWCDIFTKMYEDGIKNIIFVPTELLNLKLFVFEKLRHIRNVLLGKKDTFCGYMYSESDFKKMFSGENRRLQYKIGEVIPIYRSAIYYLDHS